MNEDDILNTNILYGPISTHTFFQDVFDRVDEFRDFCIIGKIIPVHFPIVTKAPLAKFSFRHRCCEINFSVSKIIYIISIIM